MIRRRTILQSAALAALGTVAQADPPPVEAPPDADEPPVPVGVLIDRPHSWIYGGPVFREVTIAPADHPDAPREGLRLGSLILVDQVVPRWEVITDATHGRQPWPLAVRIDRHPNGKAIIYRQWAEGDMARCRLCELCSRAAGIGPDWCMSAAFLFTTWDASTEEARVWSEQYGGPYPLYAEMEASAR